MTKKFLICLKGGTGRVIEKKSEFIGEIIPVHSEEEAQAFIESRRKQYWDARHHCYAYIIGDIRKLSDDGEPSQTAGRPMMDVLENSGLTDAVLVVTRYFGGTLLGTGGLVRAYQAAAKAALEACVLTERFYGIELNYTISYDIYGALVRSDIDIIEASFQENVDVSLVAAAEDTDKVRSRINELSNGKAVFRDSREIYYIKRNDRIEIL